MSLKRKFISILPFRSSSSRLPKNRVQHADRLFMRHYACSQAVLAAFSEEFGLDHDLALRMAAGLGGGMGRMAEACGALTGAFLVIGLKYGGPPRTKEKTYKMVRLVAEKFRERNQGCINCRDLLGCDVGTPEGVKEAREKKLFKTACRKFVRDAVEILEEVMGRE
jgi:C_GCAxxG_C_C family probable redox protein